MGRMLAHAILVVSAWDGDLLLGMARSLTDFAYCTYLSDLAVRASHQKGGIGKELILVTKKAFRAGDENHPASRAESRGLLSARRVYASPVGLGSLRSRTKRSFATFPASQSSQ
jgi:GNAT superfamily N-acetyltransferase